MTAETTDLPRAHGSWLQVNLSLFPGPESDLPFIPWAGLAEQVRRWREAGYFRQFFLVRKPPGLRLRFGGPDVSGALEPALTSWLWATERSNAIRSFRFSRYEPERHRFGGGVGLAVAHDLFDQDSTLVLRYETAAPELASLGGESLDRRQVLALSAGLDLLRRCLDDGAEVWDVWKRLQVVLPPPDGLPETDGPVSPAAMLRATFVNAVAAGSSTGLGPVDLDILRQARLGNQRVAEALVAATFAGTLTRGLRSWLTAATVFQWNRWGLGRDLAGLSETVSALTRTVEPDQAADGANPEP